MDERLTVLLSRMQGGDRAARDLIFSATYMELRRLAHYRLHDGGRNTILDTTALVECLQTAALGIGGDAAVMSRLHLTLAFVLWCSKQEEWLRAEEPSAVMMRASRKGA